MTNEEFAEKIETIKEKLYKTAMVYMGSHSLSLDVLDETIYKALCNHKKLREEKYFDTWVTRILINECYNEMRRQKRISNFDDLEEVSVEDLDNLPLKEAISRLPKDLKEIIILRYFSGFTLVETAEILNSPQGTVATRQRKALELLRLDLEEGV